MLLAGVTRHTKTPVVTIHGNLNAQKYQTNVLLPHSITHILTNNEIGVDAGQCPLSCSQDHLKPVGNQQHSPYHHACKEVGLNLIEHL